MGFLDRGKFKRALAPASTHNDLLNAQFKNVNLSIKAAELAKESVERSREEYIASATLAGGTFNQLHHFVRGQIQESGNANSVKDLLALAQATKTVYEAWHMDAVLRYTGEDGLRVYSAELDSRIAGFGYRGLWPEEIASDLNANKIHERATEQFNETVQAAQHLYENVESAFSTHKFAITAGLSALKSLLNDASASNRSISDLYRIINRNIDQSHRIISLALNAHIIFKESIILQAKLADTEWQKLLANANLQVVMAATQLEKADKKNDSSEELQPKSWSVRDSRVYQNLRVQETRKFLDEYAKIAINKLKFPFSETNSSKYFEKLKSELDNLQASIAEMHATVMQRTR